jgi:replicative DNA helicase
MTALTTAGSEAERRIVTLCCESPKAVEAIDCDPSDFGDPRWRACIRAIVELYSTERDIDPLVLIEAVSERYSGAVTMSELANVDGIAGMIPEYSRIVRTESLRRRLSLGLAAVMGAVDTEAPEATLEALAELARATGGGGAAGSVSVAELTRDRFAQYAEILDARSRGEEMATGFSTGIENLDKALGGLQPGIVTLVAARPSMGKSTLALNLTANLARDGNHVHVFSLEEPREAYADRVLSLASKVSTEKLRNVDLSRGELANVQAGAEKVLKRKGWIIDDRSGVRAEEIVRVVRLRAHANETKVVVIDYINILRCRPGEGKRDMMDQAINVFADAAKRDGMAYIVLAQLNRGLEKRDNREPQLSDLKDCGTLEERAKAVIMLHHPSEHDTNAPKDEVHLMIRKNSQGQRGLAAVSWEPERMFVGDRKGSHG